MDAGVYLVNEPSGDGEGGGAGAAGVFCGVAVEDRDADLVRAGG